MALTDMHTSRHASGLEMESGGLPPGVPPYHCTVAIDALEKASYAIACADIEARCKAVAAATEAMTSLFLEFDGIGQDFPAQGAGPLYESILGRLLNINLYNNSESAHEAIAMIEQLRDAYTPSVKLAGHGAKP